jgi:DNA invertase Pin-like site-specific DNA recombinase
MQYIAYYRVSTDRQGNSGLGLEAQQVAVKQHGGEILAEYTEIESGGKSCRPELLAALAECKRTGATLIVAKLDRLARDAKLILTLVDEGAKVKFLDLPEIDTEGPIGRLMLTIIAGVAEFERRIISKRTKEALAVKKSRGVKLGSPFPQRGGLVTGGRAKALAILNCRPLKLIVEEIKAEGAVTIRDIADQLKVRGITTTSGKSNWSTSAVHSLLKRLGD